MLRQVLVRKGQFRLPMGGRWITSAQKRALNKQQLEGKSSDNAAPPSPPPPPPKPPSTATIPSSTSAGGSDGNLLPMAAAGALALGSAAYYFYSTTNKDEAATAPAPALQKAEKAPIAEPTSSAESPEIITDSIKETSHEEEQINRVVSIQVPAKMKNEAPESVTPPPSHPESGNRVLNIFHLGKKEKDEVEVAHREERPDIDDSTSTQKALEALRETTTQEASEALIKSHQSMWSTMDKSFADLDDLTSAQLKARIVQLSTELNDRTKWEAVRLKEFLVMKEKETEDKYLLLLQKQRLEFEDLLARRLREQEHELSSQMQKVLQDKDATIQKLLDQALETQRNEHETDKKAFEQLKAAEIQSSLEEQYGKLMEEYKVGVAKELKQKVDTLDALSKRLNELETALNASKTSKQGSLKAHRLSAAALALSEKLETNESAATELAALKLAAGNEGVIATACTTIPPAVKVGVPTLPELQARFEVANKKCRQAALVPAGRLGLGGQLAGIFFAMLKYPPSPDDPAPENDKDNAEYVLVRAQKYVQVGELERAVVQLEKLTGQPAFTIEDWKKDAIDRIAVEKALKVIKMECALLNESCLDEE